MPPKKAGGRAKKTATGYRMPDHLNPGTVLSDLNKKQWVLGKTVGTGGFGELYLAKEGGKGEERVVKIEPHENGPLFVEMHFYIQAGKPDHLADYNKSSKGKSAPHIPLLRGQGSYMHKGTDNYRFLVIDKLGKDLDKIFENGAHPLSIGQVSSLAMQSVDALEYIHSVGYTHNDIKAANLLFGTEKDSVDVYLVDFGLCVKYMKAGAHKEYKADPRKAHDGTIEYLSRDAHIGCTSRRSDLEVLSFNIIHWLTGSLPWQGQTDPKKVETMKIAFVKDLDKNIKSLPKSAQAFVKYSVELGFEEEPDYDKLRALFSPELKKAGKRLSFSKTETPSRKAKKLAISPIKKSGGRSKAPAIAQDDSEEEEEEEVEPSPPISKKTKKSKKPTEGKENGVRTGKKDNKVVQADINSSDDMFSPSPKKRLKAQDIGVQTSPAFVAASKAARVGKKALDDSEYVNGVEGLELTPSNLRKNKRKAPDSSTPEARKKEGKSSKVSDGESRPSPRVVSDQPNPTPAMLAVMQRKQKADAEKSAKKRKK